MTFLKDFVNVLSGSSISFLLLSSVFGFIVFFNLLDGRLKSKGGYGFIAFGVILLVAALLMAVHFWRVRKDGGISGPV